MRIYISGPMTGVPNYKDKFDEAEKYLTDKGYDVFNPARVDDALPVKIMTYDEIMDIDLCMLRMCDAIYMLNGWCSSKGAWIELMDALANDLQVYQQLTNKLVFNANNIPFSAPDVL